MPESSPMRVCTIIASGPVDVFSSCDPYTARLEVDRYLKKHPNATEADVEQIARIFKCYVRWEN